ncbi:MAG TPA: glycoside hydrolase family 95 protein [Sphingomonas sp.]|nr:glycoside hydrolase family 95 protein [Sphingomonas sp.]
MTGPDLTRRETIAALSAGASLLAAPAAAEPASASRAADHILWYAQPARSWVEALPIGNGRIGAMVFGGAGHERLQLNEDSFWAGGSYDPVNPEAHAALPEVRRLIFAGKYAEAEALANAKVMATPLKQMPYSTIGVLRLDRPDAPPEPPPAPAPKAIESVVTPPDPPVAMPGYRRELDLDSALATTRWAAGGVTYRREAIASPVDQVIAVRLTADRPGAIDLDLSFETPVKQAAASTPRADELLLAGRNDAANGVAGALRFEARVRALPRGGTMRAEGDRLLVRGADELVVLVAMATSYRRFDDVGGDPGAITKGQIARAAARPFATIRADATASHRALYRRVALDLGATAAAALPTDRRVRGLAEADDPGLATLYFNYARYLLIACSRPGSQPANLQGLWNETTSPPWGGKYTININTEMNYWPAEPANLPECVEPLVAMVRDLAITGARTAREMYGARGWVCHHNTDLWRASAPIDGAKYGLWPSGGAWLSTMLWDHYDYGRDTAYLASIYPIIRGAALFFLDTLQHDPNTGYLVTNPSLSPENNHGHGSSLCAGPTMDMSILRDLFDQVAAAAQILGRDSELIGQLRAARARLAPFKIGHEGQLQEWQHDWDMDAADIHHRHVSHLYALYPSSQISVEHTPKLAAAARKSLEIRGDHATGWATAWRINLWARLRDGDHAYGILRYLMGPERTYPNLFDAHPPFQIDGNFGGAAAIAGMLLDSGGDEVHLLPALPSAWPTGAVRGLRARGASEVDLAWRDGRLTRAVLRTTVPGERRVRRGGTVRTIRIAPARSVTLLGERLEPLARS